MYTETLKSRDITLPTKVRLVKAMVFPVVMYRCESWTIKKGWALKKWCLQTVVLEKTLESPVEWKEIKPVYPKGKQSWIFTGRTDTEGEAPILWPPDAKSCLTGKDPDAWKDWRKKEKGTKEDEIVGWHHKLNGHEFEQTPGDGEGQGSLACCSPWGHKELDTTEWTTTTMICKERKICVCGLQTTVNISGMAIWQLSLMDIFSDLLQVFLISHLLCFGFVFFHNWNTLSSNAFR